MLLEIIKGTDEIVNCVTCKVPYYGEPCPLFVMFLLKRGKPENAKNKKGGSFIRIHW